jgi:adenylate cyclase
MAEERLQRRLAAILSADVVGYSRLMGLDEVGTLSRLNALRRKLIDPTIAAHSGRIVKLMGDGALVEFASAVDAVTCAIEIQRQVRERNASGSEDDAIRFRIGINVGDIIIEGEDILGDGVNIAARIEGIAEPGGICLSNAAYDQVRDKLKEKFVDLGEQALKNIARPVRVYRVDLAPTTSSAPQAQQPKPAQPDKPSIAVLAFDNMSGDPDQEYFSDGITEDIITSLSKNRGIFVIARNSSYAYKGQPIDVSRIGRELGVRYVLEGSVRRAGERIRITAQLIEAEGRSHVWAERYDRNLTDLFAVQDEISRSIVATVAPELLEAEMQRVRRKNPETLGAWECAMRAQWHLARLTREDIAEALRLAAQATALDPGTTLGLNIAAFAHLYAIAYGWEPSAAQALWRPISRRRRRWRWIRGMPRRTRLWRRAKRTWAVPMTRLPDCSLPSTSIRISLGRMAIWALRWPAWDVATRLWHRSTRLCGSARAISSFSLGTTCSRSPCSLPENTRRRCTRQRSRCGRMQVRPEPIGFAPHL